MAPRRSLRTAGAQRGRRGRRQHALEKISKQHNTPAMTKLSTTISGISADGTVVT